MYTPTPGHICSKLMVAFQSLDRVHLAGTRQVAWSDHPSKPTEGISLYRALAPSEIPRMGSSSHLWRSLCKLTAARHKWGWIIRRWGQMPLAVALNCGLGLWLWASQHGVIIWTEHTISINITQSDCTDVAWSCRRRPQTNINIIPNASSRLDISNCRKLPGTSGS